MSKSRLHPICDPEYRLSTAQLPPARPPRWMRLGLLLTLAAVLAVLLVTLMGPMDEYVAVSGHVRPASQRVVHSAVAAPLVVVNVRPGDRVEAGALLVTLDPWEADKRVKNLEQQVAESRAAWRLAQATQRKIEAVPVPSEFLFSPLEEQRQREVVSIRREATERMVRLQEKGGASLTDLINQKLLLIDAESALRRSLHAGSLMKGTYGDAARLEASEQVAAAETRIQALETQLAVARAERERCDVRAPEAGLVLTVTSRLPGELVPAGVPLVRLSHGDEQELRLYASEDRLSAIKAGQRVRFQARRQADKLLPPSLAEVTEVALDRDLADSAESEADNSAARETYRITARILRSEQPLPSGAEVDAEIILRQQTFLEHRLMRLGGK